MEEGRFGGGIHEKLGDAARVHGLPPDAYYVPDFISPAEEASLLQKINSVPLPRWTHLTHRRLQTWPSALTKNNTLLASPLPAWLVSPIIQRFDDLSIFADSPHGAPNHVLINEYQAGQGIMPHEDGAAYYPIVATVSLGAPIVLEVYEKNEKGERKETPQYRILQEERSLLFTRDQMYNGVLHGIAERKIDENLGSDNIANWDMLGSKAAFGNGAYERKTRVSLTYRDVLKVSKLGNSLKFLGKG